MQITRIEKITKNKCGVYLNDELAFLLYSSEIYKYHLKEGMEFTDELHQEIYGVVLSKRAKLRCMHLLEKMDRTEYQIRQKMKTDGYPQELIDEAVSYVKGYHYIDDSRYALQYIEYKKESRSRQQITYDLMGKGISSEVIAAAWEETEPVDPTAQILRWAEKKHYDNETADQKTRQRFFQFLLRKGFLLSDIKKALT